MLEPALYYIAAVVYVPAQPGCRLSRLNMVI